MSEAQEVAAPRRRVRKPAEFAIGDRVETYIGKARITGTVEKFEPAAPRRYPRIIERGAVGTPYEGWVRVSDTSPGVVTFVTDAHAKPVTRTTDVVKKIKE